MTTGIFLTLPVAVVIILVGIVALLFPSTRTWIDKNLINGVNDNDN